MTISLGQHEIQNKEITVRAFLSQCPLRSQFMTLRLRNAKQVREQKGHGRHLRTGLSKTRVEAALMGINPGALIVQGLDI